MALDGDGPLYNGLDRVLISEDELRSRVVALGDEISTYYGDREPVLVGVLTGAFTFMADLARAVTVPLDIEFMAVSSYGLQTETTGVVKIIKDLDTSIEDREVLIVEDIVDSGLTLAYLLDVLWRRNPRDIKVVALLKKENPRGIDVQVDYLGFTIPDEFVVGYGLDAARRFRNLPFIAIFNDHGG